jgi:hypothetical protein
MKINLIILTFIFISIFFTRISFAYDINCNIDVIPHSYSELVESDSFILNITLTNTGNTSFPSTPFTGIPYANISIIDPSGKILEDYYNFITPTFSLPINKSFSYIKPFQYKNETFYSFFEMPTPGTWEIKLDIISPKPLDEIVYTNTSGIIRENGECKKYFYVKDLSQYQYEQINNKNQTDSRNLNEAILVLTIILSLETIHEFAKGRSRYIILMAAVFIAIYYVPSGINNLLDFNFIMSIAFLIALLIVMTLFYRKRTPELGLLYRIVLLGFAFIDAIFINSMFAELFINQLIGTIGILGASAVLFSLFVELNNIDKNEVEKMKVRKT